MTKSTLPSLSPLVVVRVLGELSQPSLHMLDRAIHRVRCVPIRECCVPCYHSDVLSANIVRYQQPRCRGLQTLRRGTKLYFSLFARSHYLTCRHFFFLNDHHPLTLSITIPLRCPLAGLTRPPAVSSPSLCFNSRHIGCLLTPDTDSGVRNYIFVCLVAHII